MNDIYDPREDRWYALGEFCELSPGGPEPRAWCSKPTLVKHTLRARLDAQITKLIAEGKLDTPAKLEYARRMAAHAVALDRLEHPVFRRAKRIKSTPKELAALGRAYRASNPSAPQTILRDTRSDPKPTTTSFVRVNAPRRGLQVHIPL